MSINVFVSRPTPHERRQRDFLDRVLAHLKSRDLTGRTIGETDYGVNPLHQIRSVLMDCNGLLAIAFRRFHVVDGYDRPETEFENARSGRISDKWLTTPYLHLEIAMAFQMGLPILILVEEGVVLEGALESGVVVMYPPVFDLSVDGVHNGWFDSKQWNQLVNTWEGEVREVVHNKGRPPQLYHR